VCSEIACLHVISEVIEWRDCGVIEQVRPCYRVIGIEFCIEVYRNERHEKCREYGGKERKWSETISFRLWKLQHSILLFDKMGYQTKARYKKKCRESNPVEDAKYNHKREYSCR
jgi:hypothetical protein